jgi:hypothetical protein
VRQASSWAGRGLALDVFSSFSRRVGVIVRASKGGAMRGNVLLLALIAVVGAAASAAAVNATGFRVTSSLDGKKVLPLRTRWLAYPKLPPAQIKEVDFVIDGKLRWVEQAAPYNFGGDDLHGHLGFLITTWLSTGRHTFTARALAKSGRKAIDTVTVRVLPAPEPPTDLAGTWTRTVTQADLKKAGPQPPPAGVWRLVFDRVGAWELAKGGGVVSQFDAAGDVIHAFAPIQMVPRSTGGGPGTIVRFGNHVAVGGGTDCREDGPFGSYSWSVSGNQLTLTAVKEPCGNRRAIWEGVWTRAG